MVPQVGPDPRLHGRGWGTGTGAGATRHPSTPLSRPHLGAAIPQPPVALQAAPAGIQHPASAGTGGIVAQRLGSYAYGGGPTGSQVRFREPTRQGTREEIAYFLQRHMSDVKAVDDDDQQVIRHCCPQLKITLLPRQVYPILRKNGERVDVPFYTCSSCSFVAVNERVLTEGLR